MGLTYYATTGQSLYARFDNDVTGVANTAIDFTEGTGLNLGKYTISDATIAAATPDVTAGTYAGGVFIGTAGAQASGDIRVGSFSGFRWSGTAEVDEYGEVIDAIGEIDAGGGEATFSDAAAIQIAAKVVAARGTYYPPKALVWVLQRDDDGIAVKDDFIQSKGAGETAVRYIDFAALLGRNEAVESIDTLSISGSTFAITADSDTLVGNLLKLTITDGASGETGTVSFEVTTTAGQVLEGTTQIEVP